MSASSNSREFTSAPAASNVRWFVCFLLFLATTINYMDRSVVGLIEPLLHLSWMGWIPGLDAKLQVTYNNYYGDTVIAFQIAYGLGYLFAGRLIDRLGTKTGYAIAIGIWAISSMSHSLVTSIVGFCIARVFLGLGESGNFPAAMKAVTEWFPTRERALATGLFNSGTNASNFIAPVLIVAVTAHYSWRAAFICTGSMGLLWLIVWLLFPYNRLRRGSTETQEALQAQTPMVQGATPLSFILRQKGLYAFAIGKALTDGVWWFYLFYLPKYLSDNYKMTPAEYRVPLIVIYTVASVGSIAGGWLSGSRMKAGHSTNYGRKFALLVCALCVTPIVFVPHFLASYLTNPWPVIALFCLATAAHQGWSANLFSTPADMFPSTSISTVVGIGGAVGSGAGALFTMLVKHSFALHPMLIFVMAALAYLLALAIFQFLVPRLGVPREPDLPITVP